MFHDSAKDSMIRNKIKYYGNKDNNRKTLAGWCIKELDPTLYNSENQQQQKIGARYVANTSGLQYQLTTCAGKTCHARRNAFVTKFFVSASG